MEVARCAAILLLMCGSALADNRYLIEVGAPAIAPAVASAPSGIGLPGAIQAATTEAPISNMVATVIANSANFTGEYTLVLGGVAPVITYFADVPEWRAGTWNISQFVSPAMAAGKFWLGGPDATLIATNATGDKVTVLLGTLSNPLYDARTKTLQLNATVLPATDKLSMNGGITNYIQAGKGPFLLEKAPTTGLTNVALILDLRVGASAPVAETKSATASFRLDAGQTDYRASMRSNSAEGAENLEPAPEAENRMNVRTNIRSNVRSNVRSNTAEGP